MGSTKKISKYSDPMVKKLEFFSVKPNNLYDKLHTSPFYPGTHRGLIWMVDIPLDFLFCSIYIAFVFVLFFFF